MDDDQRSLADLVTVIGHAATISAGGGWVSDHEHGLQLKAASVTTIQLTTLKGYRQAVDRRRRGRGDHTGSGVIVAENTKRPR